VVLLAQGYYSYRSIGIAMTFLHQATNKAIALGTPQLAAYSGLFACSLFPMAQVAAMAAFAMCSATGGGLYVLYFNG
jgi:hypothetical protein